MGQFARLCRQAKAAEAGGKPTGRARPGGFLARLAAALLLIAASCGAPAPRAPVAAPPQAKPAGPAPSAPVTPLSVTPGEWLPLFDGRTLEGWSVVTQDAFASSGAVSLEGGALVLKAGDPFTGIVRAGEFPKEGFEIRLEAKRRSGGDIFCGLTVPVGDSHVTLVLGGWANSVAGLSNVDHRNASDNQTTVMRNFDDDRWYDVRLRVTARRILAWVDDEEIVTQWRKSRTFTVYFELEPIRPLGFFSWRTEAALRNIRMKRLWPEETKDEAAGEEPEW